MRTTAAVLRVADGPYVLEEVTLRDLRADEVLVQIKGVGMCHTDVLPRSPGFIAAPPIISGHEGAGVVQAIGSSVAGVAVGDHVVLSFDSCHACANCNAGQPAYCDTFMARNLFGRELDGSVTASDAAGSEIGARWFGQSSFAMHAIATQRNVVVVDKSLPLELLGPLGCGIQTGAGSILVALDVQPDTSVAIFGAGAVGLAAVMAAKVAESNTIIAVDLHKHRLELALELGATDVLGGDDPELVARLLEITGGGVHYAFDTTGVPAVILKALAATRMNGKVGLVGVQTGDLVLDGSALIGKTVLGILEGGAIPQQFIPRMIALWQDGRFPFDRLIKKFPLDQINEAERASLSGEVIKPVLIPSG
ncbi:MAG: NAD(P)-dependent alcohol dehydrogenase [Ilumatobacteraceae bacterium]